MKEALYLSTIVAALSFGSGCTEEITKETPKEGRISYEQFADGYKKTVFSPMGGLQGTYFKPSNQVYVSVWARDGTWKRENHNVTDLRDTDNNGIVDVVYLNNYIASRKDNREEFPKEFELADEMLKYWNEH